MTMYNVWWILGFIFLVVSLFYNGIEGWLFYAIAILVWVFSKAIEIDEKLDKLLEDKE